MLKESENLMKHLDMYVHELLKQGIDLSFSFSSINISKFDKYGLKDWFIYRFQKVKRCLNNISKWNFMFQTLGYRSASEKDVADLLNKYDIHYQYEDKAFFYYYKNKIHTYISDFYLPSINLILECKARKIRNYINFDKSLSEKIQVTSKAVRISGYEFALVNTEDSVKSILVAHDLIKYEELGDLEECYYGF